MAYRRKFSQTRLDAKDAANLNRRGRNAARLAWKIHLIGRETPMGKLKNVKGEP